MADFIEADLHGSRFERTDLSGSRLWAVDLSGAEFRGVDLNGVTMRGVELGNVDIYGEIMNVTVNGVDIGPLISAELDRRYPDRVRMRPEDPAGFREAWDIGFPVREVLLIILNEEWEHRLYAERDLDAIASKRR